MGGLVQVDRKTRIAIKQKLKGIGLKSRVCLCISYELFLLFSLLFSTYPKLLCLDASIDFQTTDDNGEVEVVCVECESWETPSNGTLVERVRTQSTMSP